MTETSVKYVYTICKHAFIQQFTKEQAIGVLPQYFSFREENGKLLLVVETPSSGTDEQVFEEVQRECDWLFFLTGRWLDPRLLRIENPDGLVGFSTFTVDAAIAARIPDDVDCQQWQTFPALAVQLRLWQLVHSSNLPIAAEINFLFQIIEIVYPDTRNTNDYPKYNNPSECPHPRTEAKFLRDLVSHGKGKVKNPQLKLYCKYLNILAELHNPTDADFRRKIKERLPVVESEARKVIENYITRKPKSKP